RSGRGQCGKHYSPTLKLRRKAAGLKSRLHATRHMARITLRICLLAELLALPCLAIDAHDRVTSFQYDEYVLTHPLVPCGPVPTALDPNGVYPYVSYCETANRPVPQKYKFVVLENGHIKVTVSPDLGGKVTSIVHKGSGKEVLYAPQVIRPTR